MDQRDFRAIESKWRRVWHGEEPYRAVRHPGRPKRYILDFFPYPSGSGLSVGHARNYVPSCICARFYRMRGFDVLHPTGWDAFGLPAENYAVTHGIHPRETTRACIDEYRRQLRLLECSYDWSREINSSDPEYYRFIQWFFLLLFERDLAYQAPGEQWWCPSCRTILANEQVEHGRCWRCATAVERKSLRQWYFRITRYADRLLNDLDRLDWPEHVKAMQTNWIGRRTAEDGSEVSYRLHDWLISRQRYWGTPIPVVHCRRCGTVPVPERDLPVVLPEIGDFAPQDDGRSPLSRAEDWVRTPCPRCGAEARRETDTMDGFACSSWYFLRFASPHCANKPFEPDAIADWLPVDVYIGGAEHAVMHLLYARFWTKVLFDAGLIPFDEPFSTLKNQGSVRSAIDGKRMSKSRPETLVTPDQVVERYGTDALRAYVSFLGPFDGDVVWSEDGIRGVVRFLDRYWELARSIARDGGATAVESPTEDPVIARARAELIGAVTRDLGEFRFNTAVAKLMEHLNTLESIPRARARIETWRDAVQTFTLLLAPFCPFVTEEVWRSLLGHTDSVHAAAWPTAKPVPAPEEQTIAVQVDGRVRARISVAANASSEEIRARALAEPAVTERIGAAAVTHVVVVPGRLVNLVTNLVTR